MLVRRPYGGLARRGESVYTHLGLLDVAGALDSLPDLSVGGTAQDARGGKRAVR